MEKEEKITKGVLPDKQFQVRPSVFSNISSDKHIKSVSHLVIAVYVIYFIKTAINDLHYGGRSQFGFKLIFETFGKIHIVALIWIILYSVHLMVFVAWRIWIVHSRSKMWDAFWLFGGFVACFGTFHLAADVCLKLNLPIGSRTIILAEQTRLIMKEYAFLRSSTEEFLAEKKVPKFSSYLYFSFAPTLIYRYSYPRTAKRDWLIVLKNFAVVLCSIHFASLLENDYFQKPLQNFGKDPYTLVDVLYIWISNSLVACVMFLILLQVIILHSVQNTFAELLRFGDREFFKDWWTKTNMNSFYVSWNVLIQDWLFTYIYKDFYEFIVPGNKAIARSAVFLLSITFHEVLLVYIANITLPVFLVSMLFSLFLMNFNLTEGRHNVVMLGFILGKSSVYMFPHLEYYAKMNCPNKTEELVYMPRLFNCFN